MRKTTKMIGGGLSALVLASAMSVAGVSVAYGQAASNISSSSEGIVVDSNLLTTMGARAGSAGPDFLGITNMNYDFQPSHTANCGDPYPYYIAAGTNPVSGKTQSGTGYAADLKKPDQFNRLAIWGSGVNTNANPYYQNLLANVLTGTAETGGLDTTTYTIATTYHSNQNSWGDVCVGTTSVISESYEPDIIFGANKTTNWSDGDYATGTYAKAAADSIEGYNPTYANNDATNLWTQIYTLEQLARTADGLTASSNKFTRYNDSTATTAALAYEKAIKGQMLYVASQLKENGGTQKTKKVAYLYAIDDGKAYFFVPTANGLTYGDDTGSGVTTSDPDSTNQEEYAANNSTINMGYMAVLPFITTTFGAAEGEGTVRESGIQMIVEDIYKRNPVVTVDSSNGATALEGVDIIIYNSTKTTGSMAGTKNGLCIDTDINNTNALNDTNVAEWAAGFGFTGTVLAGDDFGTSTQQSNADAVGATTGQAPMLYCARNYTVDKNARAAWAISKVYPELYNGNDDATYAYWLENVYHITNTSTNSKLTEVLAAYTHQSADTVNYSATNTADLNKYAEIGKTWYEGLAEDSVYKTTYAYYNGSSRASYYSGSASAEEPTNTIGIFAPSTLWTNGPGDTNVVRAFAIRLYTQILDRTPDADGLTVHVNALVSGATTPAEIVYNFFSGVEYQAKGETSAQTVERMYQVMFGRTADAEGAAMWQAYLDAGMSIRAVVAGFSQAPEYKTYFESAGLKADTISVSEPRDVNYGMTAFTQRLYNVVMGRTAEVDGLNFQTKALQDGMTCAQMAVNFFTGAEYTAKEKSDSDFVADCYQAMFGRDGSSDEVAAWVKRISTEKLSTEDVVRGFCQSDEFEAICQKYGMTSGMR